jgi:hypothetical protein
MTSNPPPQDDQLRLSQTAHEIEDLRSRLLEIPSAFGTDTGSEIFEALDVALIAVRRLQLELVLEDPDQEETNGDDNVSLDEEKGGG